mmetsp:Transcript_25295/g.46113  ORF Transcript_25295/g.46113 Transcript_25295/m.46113 type:complete len:123 (+) Transcript_25295:1124-1492(+)
MAKRMVPKSRTPSPTQQQTPVKHLPRHRQQHLSNQMRLMQPFCTQGHVEKNLREESNIDCTTTPTVKARMVANDPSPADEKQQLSPKATMREMLTTRKRSFGEKGCSGCAKRHDARMCSFLK